ncbi:MAG: L,D-transpeptidase [Desulfuromonadales bacterium]|nr:MAG: L,D-transpeptidase [Desulfuromonadales bacterium]
MAIGGEACAAAFSGTDEVVGNVLSAAVKEGESLVEMARAYGLGFSEIAGANPETDPFVPGAGARVTIPAQWIVPEAVREGALIINLSEMRLYYRFTVKGSILLVTFPVGIGSEGTETPLGGYRIVEKTVDPVWHVPKSIRKEKPELPGTVPPGPDNPLGTHALRLSSNDILIHGTNKPWGVGRKVSHGCLRLYPEDIVRLFGLVPSGTLVKIVREPVKVGIKGERVYLEVHHDDHDTRDLLEEAMRVLYVKGALGRVSMGKVLQAVGGTHGIPVDVTRRN